MTVEQVYEEALQLSEDAQETLIERLVHHLEQNIPADLEHTHLNLVRERHASYKAGESEMIPASEVLSEVRRETLE